MLPVVVIARAQPFPHRRGQQQRAEADHAGLPPA